MNGPENGTVASALYPGETRGPGVAGERHSWKGIRKDEPRPDDAVADRKIGGTQSIERAFSIIRVLTNKAPAGLRLADIAGRVELNRSTTYRFLRALERQGVVERTQSNRLYTVGADLAWLGLRATTRIPIRSAASPILDRLSQAVADAVFLTVTSGTDSICADRRLGTYPIQVLSIAVGSRRPLGVSQGGRTILAFLKENDAAQVLAQNSARFTTIGVSSQMLRETIASARRDGYLCSDGVTVGDTRVFAVPVLDINNMPIAALSVIAPRHRIPASRIPELFAVLAAAATDITDRLVETRKRRSQNPTRIG